MWTRRQPARVHELPPQCRHPCVVQPLGRRVRELPAIQRTSGVPVGTHPPWLGFRRLKPRPADSGAGREVFATQCAHCHGAAGEGTIAAPPVWGPESFAIGAGMARINTAAAFIRWNMPNDHPGSLGDQQAYDVAAFLLSHPRPDTRGKDRDWPNGDAPQDAAYATVAARHAGPARH